MKPVCSRGQRSGKVLGAPGQARPLVRSVDESARLVKPSVRDMVRRSQATSPTMHRPHLSTWKKNKAAIVWEGEDFNSGDCHYQELYRRVCKFANTLKVLGLRAGNHCVIYMPMVPSRGRHAGLRAPGDTHSVVFGGFSAEALKARIQDLNAELSSLATQLRRGKQVLLKQAVDDALANNAAQREARHRAQAIRESRFHDLRPRPLWHELTTGRRVLPREELDSEHPLYVLYTSARPASRKASCTHGRIPHRDPRYMDWVFDLKEEDVFWCTADIGWSQVTHTWSTGRWPPAPPS